MNSPTHPAIDQFGTSEPRWARWIYALLAIAFCALFLTAALCFWTPAHPGVDQNGYLVGGKQFAETFSMGLTPADPFGFVGRMWIGTPSQTFYPKYPLGLPFLFAVAFWIGGSHTGVILAHLISPVAIAVALAGCYFLIRLIVPSFYAILGVIILATSPVTLWCVNNPNSHASTLACVAWGMYLLFRWWQSGGLWRARGAGFLIGYAATIRYTEGLLILPVFLVVLFKVFERPQAAAGGSSPPSADPDSDPSLLPTALAVGTTCPLPAATPRRQSLLLLCWWALPLVILVTFNLFWFGDLTGYDSTNESTGFAWEYFADNWETMLRQFHTGALFFTLPLAVVGVAYMFAWNWRLATVLVAWILPGTLLYTAYYWAPDAGGFNPALGYMRFFLTLMPPLVMAAMWFIRFISATAIVTRRAAINTTSALVAFIAVVSVNAYTWADTDHTLLWRLGLCTLAPAVIGFGLAWLMQHTFVSQQTDTTHATAIVIAALTAVFASLVQLSNATPSLETDYRNRLTLAQAGENMLQLIPSDSVIFGPQHFLHHLQFIADYRLYDPDQFNSNYIRKLKNDNPDEPTPLQPQRAMYLYDLLKDADNNQLQAQLNGIIRRSLTLDKNVYFIANKSTFADYRRRVERAQRNRKQEWTAEDDQTELLNAVFAKSPAAAKGLHVEIVERWPDAPVVVESTPEGRKHRGPAALKPQRWQPQGEWTLYQITLAPPPPPATQPTK